MNPIDKLKEYSESPFKVTQSFKEFKIKREMLLKESVAAINGIYTSIYEMEDYSISLTKEDVEMNVSNINNIECMEVLVKKLDIKSLFDLLIDYSKDLEEEDIVTYDGALIRHYIPELIKRYTGVYFTTDLQDYINSNMKDISDTSITVNNVQVVAQYIDDCSLDYKTYKTIKANSLIRRYSIKKVNDECLVDIIKEYLKQVSTTSNSKKGYVMSYILPEIVIRFNSSNIANIANL